MITMKWVEEENKFLRLNVLNVVFRIHEAS